MISIAIPYHDSPKTAFYLSRLLKSLDEQTYTDYEVVLTKEGPFARNHNAAIVKAKGEYIQMMQMDDYFSGPDALRSIVQGLTNAPWQITACSHDINGVVAWPHEPQWTEDIFTGNNRLGSVSTLSFRRENALLMEEPLTWLVDCDLYYRLYLRHGLPCLNSDRNVVVTERPDRLTHTLSKELKDNEVEYLKKKYGK